MARFPAFALVVMRMYGLFGHHVRHSHVRGTAGMYKTIRVFEETVWRERLLGFTSLTSGTIRCVRKNLLLPYTEKHIMFSNSLVEVTSSAYVLLVNLFGHYN